MPPKPYYTLKQLIYKKYGEDRFALGTEIVARWVSFDIKVPVRMEIITIWCNTSISSQSMNIKVSLSLLTLFSLKNLDELITQ